MWFSSSHNLLWTARLCMRVPAALTTLLKAYLQDVQLQQLNAQQNCAAKVGITDGIIWASQWVVGGQTTASTLKGTYSNTSRSL